MTKKPSYRFAGYTEPWEEKKLGEVSDRYDNLRVPVSANERVSGNIPYYGANGIQDYVDGYTHDGEFILIAEDGASDLKDYPVQYVNGKVWVNNHAHVIQGKNDLINNIFLLFAVKQINIEPFLVGGGRAKLNSDVMMKLPLQLPSLPEQTAIGSFFQDIDQLISLQQRKLDVLKEQKKTYLKLLFPAKGQTKPALRFAGFEDDWKEVKLGEVFDIVTDYVANGSFESLRNNVRTYEKDNFAYMIRLQDASNSWKGPWLYTDEKGYNFLSKSRLFKDDILMSNVGTVGRFFQVPELDRPMTLAPNSVLIRSTSSNNQFLYFMMLTANIQDQITMRKTPGVQDKINKTDFKRVIATLPALPEQEAIASFFQDLDKAIAKQEEKVNQLKESKQTLLRKMFI